MLLLLAVFIAVLFILPITPLAKDVYQVVVVRSGSMEPTIKTGGLVIYANVDTYGEGDVVAFRNQGTSQKIITIHRIMRSENQDDEIVFFTKGDANDAEDPNPLKQEELLGKVIFSVPFLGFIVSWMKTGTGIALLVILPLALLGYHELQNIMKKRKKKKSVTVKKESETESLPT